MHSAKRMAEIVFKNQRVHFYGEVTRMGQEQAAIRLLPPVEDPALFQPGAAAEIIVVSNGPIYVADVEVVSETNGEVVVTYVQPVCRIDRRNSPRRACEVRVQFRKAEEDDREALWLEAVTGDISVGGLSLLIPPGIDLPGRLALRFELPVDRWPITATARVAHRRARPDGRTTFGLAFTALDRLDEIRLTRFTLEAPPAAAA